MTAGTAANSSVGTWSLTLIAASMQNGITPTHHFQLSSAADPKDVGTAAPTTCSVEAPHRQVSHVQSAFQVRPNLRILPRAVPNVCSKLSRPAASCIDHHKKNIQNLQQKYTYILPDVSRNPMPSKLPKPEAWEEVSASKHPQLPQDLGVGSPGTERADDSGSRPTLWLHPSAAPGISISAYFSARNLCPFGCFRRW